jgi:ABC-type transport system substrate-binding protein
MGKRLWLSIVTLAIGVGLLVAAGFASPASSNSAKPGSKVAKGGTLRIDTRSDYDFVDPALAYYSHSWNFEYATVCKLLNFPDKEASAGGTQVRPEVATSLPAVSRDGKTYTFTLRKTFRFADGSKVTAANFAYALNRDLQPKMSSPSTTFIEDIAGAKAVLDGKASKASGIKVLSPYKLRITLNGVAPDFLARITMPFFSAVETNLPINPDGISAPAKGASCGPYYVSDWTQKRQLVLSRNTFYKGPRPHNPDQVVSSIGISLDAQRLRVESGDTDLGGFPPAAAAELRDKYGVNKLHTGKSPSFLTRHQATFWYLNLNQDQPLFHNNAKLGEAVNYGIDRHAMAVQHGALGGVVTDHILPIGFPGYKKYSLYPLKAPNTSKAAALAKGNLRGGKCDFWTFNTAPGPQVAQIVQFNLGKIGLNCNITPLDRVVQTDKAGVKGAKYDILLNGWGQDYPDPFDFINILLSGTSIQPANNVNLSYFNTPTWNRRMLAASKLSGAARFNAYAKLDHDLMKGPAPMAPYIDQNARIFISKRVGCYVYSQVYGSDLASLCVPYTPLAREGAPLRRRPFPLARFAFRSGARAASRRSRSIGGPVRTLLRRCRCQPRGSAASPYSRLLFYPA